LGRRGLVFEARFEIKYNAPSIIVVYAG